MNRGAHGGSARREPMPPERTAAFAPGRVNLLGEHTDYNDGLALPFAITAGVTVTAVAIRARRIEARALDLGEDDAFELDAPAAAEGWRAFVRGVSAELGRAGYRLRGARITISGDVTRGAGLASSAALEVALCLALLALTGTAGADRIELARLCARVENRWVGAQTGLLDQLAALCGRRGAGLRIDFRNLDVQPVPLELGAWRLVILDSGELRGNASSGYNERRNECAAACAALGVGSLRDVTEVELGRIGDPLRRRVRHVLAENSRVEAGVAALRAGDLAALGALLDESHASQRDLYEVSTPAVEAAVGRLREAGAAGARLIGGGFGGHVLGLLPPGIVPPPGAVEVRPGPGALVLDR